MRITYYGQNCWSIETAGRRLLIDPALSANPLTQDTAHADSLEADYILLTHAHFDHVADVETIASRTGATIVANYEIATYYGGKGYKYHPMNHGGKWKFEFGTLAMVNAIHSSVFHDGTYGGNAAGFIIYNNEASIYLAGDTAVTLDMQLIPKLYPSLDLAILPVGDNFTMGYQDAVLASDLIECNRIVGCHFDSFPYIVIDHAAAKKAFEDAGKSLSLLEIQESLEV